MRIFPNENPGRIHLREVGLRGAKDRRIWISGRAQGFAIVAKDVDFRERGFIEGFPPKVIRLNVGNAGPR